MLISTSWFERFWCLQLDLQVEDSDIYDTVSEEQYKSIVKGRLQRDDFVVDDGTADGYVDNGMDDWMGGNTEDDYEEEEELPKAKCTLYNSFLKSIILVYL